MTPDSFAAKARDPRKNPKVGDVILDDGDAVLVFALDQRKIWVRSVFSPSRPVAKNWWTRFSRDAEVIHVAD